MLIFFIFQHLLSNIFNTQFFIITSLGAIFFKEKKTNSLKFVLFFAGGGEESWTPVQNSKKESFSESSKFVFLVANVQNCKNIGDEFAICKFCTLASKNAKLLA